MLWLLDRPLSRAMTLQRVQQNEIRFRDLHMAEMIPDRLPSGASAGEKKVFALLQELPDDVIVYYEPVVADRYPDFIVIIPSIGLLVIEVKGWYPNAIERADNT